MCLRTVEAPSSVFLVLSGKLSYSCYCISDYVLAQHIAIMILRPTRKVIKQEIVLKKKTKQTGSIYKTGPEVEFPFGFLVRGPVHLLKHVDRPPDMGFFKSVTLSKPVRLKRILDFPAGSMCIS